MFIGREKECNILNVAFDSANAEFISIYGRRRVGKTTLVRSFAVSKKEAIFFQITGLKNGKLSEQLSLFAKAISKTFFKNKLKVETPKSWLEAFEMLTEIIEEKAKKQKVILFFDELPWLSSKRSNFIQSLDYFWNTEWSNHKNIKLIVCGSAASWMLNNLINAKGGLHNRLTKIIKLYPFTLKETKWFLRSKKIDLNDRQILTLYMIFGGVPFYLNEIMPGLSAHQNINELCFSSEGKLFNEFDRLFASLFEHAEIHEEIISLISNQREGVTKDYIVKRSKLSSMGGRLSKRLKELEESGFIISYIPFGKTTREKHYKLHDEYSLFYLKWIEPIKNKDIGKDYWHYISNSASFNSWTGYAFELVCYKHIFAIRKALKIPDGSAAYSWKYIPSRGVKEQGAQIDLLFDRSDNVITICEIKCTQEPFVIDKTYAKNLQNKIEIYKKITKTTKQLFLVMITIDYVKKTMYSEELLSGNVVLEDLF